MCHIEKCFLCSFQFYCKIIHFMSLGLRYWEGATDLPLLAFTTATSTWNIKFPLLQAGACQAASPHKCCSELWSSCCCIISIYAVSFSRVMTGLWSRHKHSGSPSCSLCPSFPHGSLCLICLFNLPEAWAQCSNGTLHSDTLYCVITSDSMPECSFFCFSWCSCLFLATLSPPHPITFSHRWTFGFPRCCLCQIVVLLACVTAPAWELHLRCLGARLGYCCPVRGFCSVSTLNFEMCLKWFIKPLSTKWALPKAASLPPSSPPALLRKISQLYVLSPFEKHGCLFCTWLGWSRFLFKGTNQQADLHSLIGWLSLAKIQNSVSNRTECDIFFSSCFPEFKMPRACEGESQNRAAFSHPGQDTAPTQEKKALFIKFPFPSLRVNRVCALRAARAEETKVLVPCVKYCVWTLNFC